MKYLSSVLLGLAIALFGLEVGLRFFPVNSGVRMDNTTAAQPYARFLPQQSFLYSYGWAMINQRHGVTNRQGFNNSKDFSEVANVLVIGDSFIEAQMLDYADTIQGILDVKLGKVYAAAASGNGLADELQLARHFLPTTQAKILVFFIEPSDVSQILLPGARGHSFFAVSENKVTIQHVPYSESRFKRTLLNSALLRYFYYNLKFFDWASSKLKKPAPAPKGNEAAILKHHTQRSTALNYFMSELSRLQQQYDANFVFLVDGNRKEIYTPGTVASDWSDGDRKLLLNAIRENGFKVVDMHPVFEDHWNRHKERMDFLPADGHWNKVAHELAAQEVLKEIATIGQ
jgi:hypothetical protein